MEEIAKSWKHVRDARGNVIEILESPKICFDYLSEGYTIKSDETIFRFKR